MPPQKRENIFISYSHKDKKWLEKLQTMLAPLVRKGMIKTWADTSLVLTFRSLYQTLSSQVTTLRPEILQQLAVLTQRSEDILVNIQILHLQVRSRMKRPVTSLGKTSMLTSLSRANCLTSA